MSSYLTFYLVPKKDKAKEPLAFLSYSRNSNIYQAFYKNISVAYRGNGDVPNYTELTKDLVNKVFDAVKADYDDAQKNFATRMEAYRSIKLEGKAFEDYVDDFQSTTRYLEELKETVAQVESIAFMVEDLEYSDFEKILINID